MEIMHMESVIMNRTDFIEILRSQLSGNMQEGRAAAHIRYYEDYIQSQVRGGKSEAEVLAELGDPRLIAKTLIDTSADDGQEEYEEYTSEGYSEGGQAPERQQAKWKKYIDLSTWYGKAIVIAAAILAIMVIIAVIGTTLPFFLMLAVILYVLSWLKKRR